MNSALIVFCSIAIIMIGTSVAVEAQASAPSGKQSPPALAAAKSIQELIDRYFDSLNELDDKRRSDLNKQVWAEKGKFGTPYGEVEGLEAIDALVAGVHKKFPNATVRRTTKIDGFGSYLRWGFTLSDANDIPILSGVDFAIVESGKLQLVMGFFDFAPKLEIK
jgi:hypothetical protein